MNNLIKAPSVTSLRVIKLGANYVYIKWDNAGGNFYYLVEFAQYEADETVNVDELMWSEYGFTVQPELFMDNLVSNTKYIFRIASTFEGFERSEWVYTDELHTFDQNVFSISSMEQLLVNNVFIDKKFNKNETSYVDFNNDAICASLMNDKFVYEHDIGSLSYYKDYIVDVNEHHEMQGKIQKVCKDYTRAMLGWIDDVLYIFERFQSVVKVSNDKGQNWKYYKAFSDRVGNPVSNTCIYQNNTTTFILGYEHIFYGRKGNDERWSSNTIRFSSDSVTFSKMKDDNELGFDVELFSTYVNLPADLNKRVEAFSASDKWLYLGGKNIIRRLDLVSAPIDSDPSSPTFGQRIWDPEVIKITDNDRIVIKKMDFFKDKVYIYVTGMLKDGKYDPTKTENVIPCDEMGVYIYDVETSTVTRIFGDLEEERTHIVHEFTNMSTDGEELFFAYNEYSMSIIEDDTIHDNDNVTSAVKFYQTESYPSDKYSHQQITMRTSDGITWKFAPNKYYMEPFYNWLARTGVRCWITNMSNCLIIYPEKVFTQNLYDTNDRFYSEEWEKGKCTVYMTNVNFSYFNTYASGILFHKFTGEVIGYYEFPYRVRDTINIIWKPDGIMLIADLLNQERPVEEQIIEKIQLIDPDLRPLVERLGSEAYLYEDSIFKDFIASYLEYVSNGNTSPYNKLLNLVKNKYPREEDNITYLWSEIRKRNIYLDANKRETVTKFFEARSTDFYSTKGIIESYKFLFKLLYDADVDVEVESENSMEYDVIIYSNNITEDIVGRTIYTDSGRANVTYIEKDYTDGHLVWRVTLHNMYGKFESGVVVRLEKTDEIIGVTIRGIKGKDLAFGTIDYINRGRVYYQMKIKSELLVSRYKNDVLRFVHPVGYGFIGVVMLVVFINYGISMKHAETVINIMKAYRWDSGLPDKYPDTKPQLDQNGNVVFDINGDVIEIPYTLAGQDPIIHWPTYDQDEDELNGILPSERRRPLSPLFDGSWTRFSLFKNLNEKRLKDNIGNPRDPENPTQVRVDDYGSN